LPIIYDSDRNDPIINWLNEQEHEMRLIERELSRHETFHKSHWRIERKIETIGALINIRREEVDKINAAQQQV
jgi:hypothetical protein